MGALRPRMACTYFMSRENIHGKFWWGILLDSYHLENWEINGKVILRFIVGCVHWWDLKLVVWEMDSVASKCDLWIDSILLYVCHCPFVGVSVSSISISALPGPSQWHQCKRVSGWSNQHPVQAEAAAGRCSGWGKDICMAVSGLAWNKLASWKLSSVQNCDSCSLSLNLTQTKQGSKMLALVTEVLWLIS